jgi:hypothetical protein
MKCQWVYFRFAQAQRSNDVHAEEMPPCARRPGMATGSG